MNLHEYQSKDLFRSYGIPVPNGKVAFSASEAVDAANSLNGDKVIVKAQVHAGGRGKAGGVKIVDTAAQAGEVAGSMLGTNLVTFQTDANGQPINRILVEETCDIANELYLGVVLDRSLRRVVIMASTEGGVEIEEVAAKSPEKIIKVAIDPVTGFMPFHGRQLAYGLGLEGTAVKKAVAFMMGLYRCIIERDASLVEINPLVVTTAGELVALDAKMSFDDNALFRHADLAELRDLAEED
ncbi:MAG: succinate--CoA ligase subunit beta, partial [Gammaproteobacteria bacterium]